MLQQLAPETAEGWAVLHQFFHFDRPQFSLLPQDEQKRLSLELQECLSVRAEYSPEGQSASYQLFGHHGDLLLIHFRKDFDELAQCQLEISRLAIAKYLHSEYSYLSVVELGMYSATVAIRERLKEKGVVEGSEEWTTTYKERLAEVVGSMTERLYTPIPDSKFVCFYPMNKKRTDKENWYVLPIEERNNMMASHGRIGREFKGRVVQVITGSIGFDDWEWGVDLFADDPLVFKELVYVMRFDEGSARYGDFGAFYVGRKIDQSKIGEWLGSGVAF
jgi:chlorite dismutase